MPRLRSFIWLLFLRRVSVAGRGSCRFRGRPDVDGHVGGEANGRRSACRSRSAWLGPHDLRRRGRADRAVRRRSHAERHLGARRPDQDVDSGHRAGRGRLTPRRPRRERRHGLRPRPRPVLDGVYRTTEGLPVFRAVHAPTATELQALLLRIIKRLMNRMHRCYVGPPALPFRHRAEIT